ncbi:Hsp20/alpha crystallin family protein [Patescibacteria group bacterium]|nr:Hsp20/alpha crystallin family protein [Patescibacteria group bacterium]MBU3999850.1 Hsp20/alpha crystallin family protein [Patescibacteria group bacterium]MBU4056990.1 Hsp20/alpha crystallin family protein [Patescibacteria group bacterium]MBU4369092.1 Hsp20/alpha crystallin family protein [Patescibacteria group bacterium]
MVKKYNKKENPKASSNNEDYKTKKENGEINLGLGGLFGGLFKGIEGLIDLAEKAEKAGGTLRREREFGGRAGSKSLRGIYGFTVKTGIGGKRSRVETFGNVKKTKQGPRVMENREPLVDVFDEKNCVLVIAELPGVQEKDIKLHIKGNVLNLETTGERKYAKEILLPAKTDFESRKVNFKNGILEVKLKKI